MANQELKLNLKQKRPQPFVQHVSLKRMSLQTVDLGT